MSTHEDMDLPEGGDDLLAAEYVLGVLDADDRLQAAMRVESDRAFAALVDHWIARFEALNDAYAPHPVATGMKSALDKRLFGEPEKQSWLSSIAFWRLLSAGALAALLIALMPRFVGTPVPADISPIVASLQAESGELRFIALYEPGQNEIRLSRVKADKAAGRDFELWLIEDGAAPVSLGLVPAGGETKIKVTAALAQKISVGDVFAVSDEPSGGSTTGAPTGPVIAVGPSQAI